MARFGTIVAQLAPDPARIKTQCVPYSVSVNVSALDQTLTSSKDSASLSLSARNTKVALVVWFGKIVALHAPELVTTNSLCALSNVFKNASVQIKSPTLNKDSVAQKLSASRMIKREASPQKRKSASERKMECQAAETAANLRIDQTLVSQAAWRQVSSAKVALSLPTLCQASPLALTFFSERCQKSQVYNPL